MESEEVTVGLPVLLVMSPEDLFCAQDQEGDNELMLALVKGHENYFCYMVDVLVKRKSHKLLNIRNNLRHTVLHLAVLTDSLLATKKLVQVGVDLGSQDHRGDTALHRACSLGYLKHAVAITTPVATRHNSGVSKEAWRLAETLNYQGWNCLHVAVQKGYCDIAEHMWSLGVDVNKPGGGRGMSALHIATQARDTTMIIFLIHKLQADVNRTTFDKWTAIEFATFHNDDILISLLLSCGAYVSEMKNCHTKFQDAEDT